MGRKEQIRALKGRKPDLYTVSMILLFLDHTQRVSWLCLGVCAELESDSDVPPAKSVAHFPTPLGLPGIVRASRHC